MKSSSPKYQTYEVGSPLPFTIYCAGEGQEGGGYLVFEESHVRVVLRPESGWKTATKAKRKDANKLRDSGGNWSIWFLLARAFALSRESLEEAIRGIGPADTMKQAANQLRSAGKAAAFASDARQHAILEALKAGYDIPLEAASTEINFTEWFEAMLAGRLAANDSNFVDAVNGFIRATNGLQKGYPSDVIKFRRVLAEHAWTEGCPPTKGQVREALGVELAKSFGNAEKLKQSHSKGDEKFVQRDSSSDLIEPNTFTRLLKRTGFSWLPNGKPGLRRTRKFDHGGAKLSWCGGARERDR
jgi:hypothetical protein